MERLQLVLFYILSITFLPFFFYVFFHEMGHGLIGVLCGGKITRLNLGFKAHIRIENASYNAFTLPLMYANGTILPITITLLLLLIYNGDFNNAIYHFVHFGIAVSTPGSLLPWIIIPMIPKRPQNDDVTKFIQNSKIYPRLISLLAFLLCFGFICFIIDTGVLVTVISILRNG